MCWNISFLSYHKTRSKLLEWIVDFMITPHLPPHFKILGYKISDSSRLTFARTTTSLVGTGSIIDNHHHYSGDFTIKVALWWFCNNQQRNHYNSHSNIFIFASLLLLGNSSDRVLQKLKCEIVCNFLNIVALYWCFGWPSSLKLCLL